MKKIKFISLIFILTLSAVSQKNVTGKPDAQQLAAFMNEQIECENYVFPPGRFPHTHWKNALNVEALFGKMALTVSYFNEAFQKVAAAEKPGRYGAVIEAVTPSGFVIKRYITLFCAKTEFDDYSVNVPITINNLAGYNISNFAWTMYSHNEEHFSFGSLKYFPAKDPDAAIFLAGLSQIDSTSLWYETPRIKDRQWWITLKGKLSGKSEIKNPLKKPLYSPTSVSTVLSDLRTEASRYDSAKIENVRTVCSEWNEKGGVPNVTLIVHKGKIIFYEAFGTDENGTPLTKNSLRWMASITKLLTGSLVMQFVEQGIINLDAPVSTYLPELSGANADKLTIRTLLNHTSGLQNSGDWASDWNVSLENQIAEIFPSLHVGETFSYHRAGYAVAGKIIERITGRAVPYLFQEYIFQPLGMSSAYSDNTYGGLYCSVLDLAKFGQMLLNKGIYNGYRFFSPSTFSKMLPLPLSQTNKKWGAGTTLMGGYGLSEETFGHGAASGTIFRLDPKNDLIIVSARNREGKLFHEYENKLLKSCTALITK